MTWLWVLSRSWNASLELSTKIPSRKTASKRKQPRSQANGQQTADVLSGGTSNMRHPLGNLWLLASPVLKQLLRATVSAPADSSLSLIASELALQSLAEKQHFRSSHRITLRMISRHQLSN
jgi:hypothetical protein